MSYDIVTTITLTSEVFSLIILGILLYAILFENAANSHQRKSFIITIVCTLLALLFDVLSYVIEIVPFANQKFFTFLFYSINLLAIICGNLMTQSFGFYEFYLIHGENENKKKTFPIFNAIFNFAFVLFAIVTCCCGSLIEIGTDPKEPFVAGIFYVPCLASVIISTIMMIIYAIINFKNMDKHNFRVFVAYLAFPLVVGIAEFITDVYISYCAAAISCIMVYVMLQSGHIDELKIRENVLNEFSYIDSLTNVANRRAYNDDLDNAGKHEFVGIIFCDVNRLKYINDHYGHKKGDDLLVKFVDVSSEYFTRKEIYRISGDEFVIMTFDMKEEDFVKKCRDFRVDMIKNDELSSLGYVYGSTNMIMNLISEAENKMYKYKEDYHERYPEYSRD